MDESERFGSLLSMDAGPFEHSNELVEKSHRIPSRRLLTRMHRTLEKKRSIPDSVQRLRSEVREDFVGTSVLRKIECSRSGGRYLARHKVCSFLGQLSKGVERA